MSKIKGLKIIKDTPDCILNKVCVKYLATTNEFEFSNDNIFYFSQGTHIKVSKVDLEELILADTNYKSGEETDLGVYTQYGYLPPEKQLVDLDDDSFNDLCVIQATHKLSLRTLKIAERENHRRKLKRTNTSKIELKKREINI